MPPDSNLHGDWDQYKILVLNYMERIENQLADIQKSMNKVQIEVAMLQVKSGMWGALGGLIVGVGATLLTKIH